MLQHNLNGYSASGHMLVQYFRYQEGRLLAHWKKLYCTSEFLEWAWRHLGLIHFLLYFLFPFLCLLLPLLLPPSLRFIVLNTHKLVGWGIYTQYWETEEPFQFVFLIIVWSASRLLQTPFVPSKELCVSPEPEKRLLHQWIKLTLVPWLEYFSIRNTLLYCHHFWCF